MTAWTQASQSTRIDIEMPLAVGRVLVVDDEERMAASLKAILTKEGHEVSVAHSGEEAIACIAKTPFDVLLVDVRMPKIDGVDVLRAARDAEPDRPVVLMTAYASLESAVAALNEGAYDYLLKPIDLTEVRLTVRRAVEIHKLNQMRELLLEELQEKNRTLSRRVVELNALHEVGAALSTTGEVNQLLKSILHLATGVIGSQYGSIMLVDEERGTLRVAATSGLAPASGSATELPLGDSIAGQVARTGEPVIIKDVENDPRIARRNRPQFTTASLICAPLKTPNAVLGVINLSDKRDHTTFTMEDLRLLVTLATQAAMAIEDAQHYQMVRRQLAEVTALHDLSGELSHVERTDEMVAAVSTTLRRLVPCDRIQWWEWQGESKQIMLVFQNGQGMTSLGSPATVSAPCEVLDDPDECARVIRDAYHEAHPDQRVGAVLALPVRSAENPLGVFALHRLGTLEFSQHEIHLARIVQSQAERIFERQRALLNASRLVTMGKMISEISHDLRKPLTNIRGSLQVLESRVEGDREQVKILKDTEQEIVRLATLVKELVDFSNPKRYRTERCDLAPSLKRAVDLTMRAAEKARVTLTAHIPDHLPPIFCEENQCIEALLNILMNAVEAMPDGGNVDVHATVQHRPSGDEFLLITVTDDGPGMSPQELARIFERYYTTKESGTGLGLPIVQRIIQSHDGEVIAESEPGVGTTFRIELPVR